MRRLLVLTRYDDLGSSSRYRALQYLPYLRQHGFKVDVSPLLDNDYLRRLYGGLPIRKRAIVKSMANRVWLLIHHHPYDLIWIEKEALPFVPGWLERLLLGRRLNYVVDYDDAVFHNYDRHRNPIVRTMLNSKYDAIIRGARIVITGNSYLAQHAEEAGAKSVEILPTVVDLDRYVPVLDHNTTETVFGWIGTPVTAKYLEIVRPVVTSMNHLSSSKFVTIGSGPLDWAEPRMHTRPWTAASEVDELRKLSVGLMPLDNTPFERGKCGLKLIQYMAVGLPVLASPVGVNGEIVEPGINGFLCDSDDDWRSAITLLESDTSLRERLGRAGRKKVEEKYSLQNAAPRLASLLEKAANSPG